MTVTVTSESAMVETRDRLVVSPVHGRVELVGPISYTAEGEFVRAEQVIARVASDGQHVEVFAPCDAWVMGHVVRDGQRVEPGTAIVHLRAV